jgi:hypothetical protein
VLKLSIAGESDGTWPVPVSASLVQEWRDRNGQVRAFGYAEGRRGWLEWPGLATFAFEEGSEDVLATPSAGATARAIEEMFRRGAVPIILQARGWEALHARAVLAPRGVVGLCGAADSAAFALTYGLDRFGYRQCADSALLLNLRGVVRVESYPFFPRPSSSALEVTPAERLCALFVVVLAAANLPRLKRLAGAEAFSALVAHAYCFNPVDPEAKRRLVANYVSLVSQVPIYQLELEGGPQQVEAAKQLILDTVSTTVLVSVAR